MSTLKDVAEYANVSIATVSCCLSGAKHVKPETRMRVMEAIDALKYIPNFAARNLKVPVSKEIGIILTDIDDVYHADILKGISSYFQQRGYSINVAFSNNSPDVEREIIDGFIGINIAGLLIVSCQPQNTGFYKSRLTEYNIPSVFIERQPKGIDHNFIGFNNKKTVNFITNKLIQKGYSEIALICGPSLFSSESDCISGYKDAFKQNNMSADPELVNFTNMSKEDAFKASAYLFNSKKTDAVITTSTTIAKGALEAAHILGIQIPDGMLIVTFGEECWNKTNQLHGVIHTSRTAFTLGSSAAELLLANINSPLLFEPQYITFTDSIINSEFNIPAKVRHEPKAVSIKEKPCLNILMSELTTSHAAMLVSKYFSNRYGIEINIDFAKQNILLDKILKDNVSDNKYDIYMFDVPWLDYLAQNLMVADITDFIEGSDFNKKRLFPDNLKNCLSNNRYYGIPIIGGSQIMFYRKDLFENPAIMKSFKEIYKIPLRPPKTWTEFNGIAEFFTKKLNPDSPVEFGTSFAGISSEELAPELLIRLWSFGGKIIDSKNAACFNTPQNIKAFNNILKTLNYIDSNPLRTSINKTVNDFCSGKTAMLITYSEYAENISSTVNASITGSVGYCSLPGNSPLSIGWNLGMSNFTKKSEYVYKYFNWVCQQDISYYMTILDGQSAVVDPYNCHELLKLYPWMNLTSDSFKYCRRRTGPNKKNAIVMPPNILENLLCDVLRRILDTSIPIEDSLEIAQVEAKHLLKSYGY